VQVLPDEFLTGAGAKKGGTKTKGKKGKRRKQVEEESDDEDEAEMVDEEEMVRRTLDIHCRECAAYCLPLRLRRTSASRVRQSRNGQKLTQGSDQWALGAVAGNAGRQRRPRRAEVSACSAYVLASGLCIGKVRETRTIDA
jgi:hypothetical protein